MNLVPDRKENIRQKVMAIERRIFRYERGLESCMLAGCSHAVKLNHELDMIKKAASEIIEEIDGIDD